MADNGGTDRHCRDWSALPDPAVLLVSQHLPCFVDYFAFAGTCTSWRSVAKYAEREFMARHAPLLFNPDALAFYSSLRQDGGRVFSSSESRLARPRGRAPRVLNVWHGYFVIDAPGPPSPSSSSEKDHRRLLRVVNPLTGDEVRGIPPIPTDHICWAVLVAPPSSPACRVMVYCNNVHSSSSFSRPMSIFMWWPGAARWKKAGNAIRNISCPVIAGWWVCAWSEANVGVMVCEFPTNRHRMPHFLLVPADGLILPSLRPPLLASAGGKLWLVSHAISAEAGGAARAKVAVFQLDSIQPEWVKLRSLGRRALLLSSDGCVVAEDPTNWGGRENWVYLVDDAYKRKLYGFPFPEKEEEEELALPSALGALPYTRRGWTPPFWILPTL